MCESEAAIDLVQERNRELLKALSREQPALYRELGEDFTARRELLRQRAVSLPKRKRGSTQGRTKTKAPAQTQETKDA